MNKICYSLLVQLELTVGRRVNCQRGGLESKIKMLPWVQLMDFYFSSPSTQQPSDIIVKIKLF